MLMLMNVNYEFMVLFENRILYPTISRLFMNTMYITHFIN